jgi:hypothetical protein
MRHTVRHAAHCTAEVIGLVESEVVLRSKRRKKEKEEGKGRRKKKKEKEEGKGRPTL